MKFIVFTCFLALALARPDSSYRPKQVAQQGNYAQAVSKSSFAKILRDDRVHPEDGSYSFNVETDDGIVRSESGSKLSIEGYPVGQQGAVAFTFPTGEKFDLKFVADENGYQPQSAWLPVAPEFPHPIPQFVLDQIAKAAREDAEGVRSAPSQKYDKY